MLAAGWPTAARCHGQCHRDARAAISRCIDLNGTPVHLHNPAADVQAESHACYAREVLPGVRLVEAFEDVRPMLRRNADAVVAHAQLQAALIGTGQLDIDGTTVRAVLDRVVDQIGDHLLESHRVNRRQAALRRLDGNGVPRTARSGGVHRRAHQRREIGRLGVDGQSASIQTRGVQQLSNQASDAVGLPVDLVQRFVDLVAIQTALTL